MKRNKTEERKRISAKTALTIRITACILGLWLVVMSLFTVGTAQWFYEQICENASSMAGHAVTYGRVEELYDETQIAFEDRLPGTLTTRLLETLRLTYSTAVEEPGRTGFYYGLDHIPVYRSEYRDGIEAAGVLFDREGNVVFTNGDYVLFDYKFTDTYQTGTEKSDGMAYMDISSTEDYRYGILQTQMGNIGWFPDIWGLRMTGYFDGDRFEPYAMAKVSDDDIWAAIENREPDETIVNPDGSVETRHEYTLQSLEQEGLIEYHEYYDYTADAPQDKELVTIYADHLTGMKYEQGGPVTYGEEKYTNLTELIISKSDDALNESHSVSAQSKFDLFDTIYFSASRIYDLREYVPGDESTWPGPEYTLVTAVHASPILIAMSYMVYVYIGTFLLAALMILFLRRSLSKNLLDPLAEVNAGAAAGYLDLPFLREDSSPKWQETYDLVHHYFYNRGTLRMQKNEMDRQKQALSYAKNAEENRRQMTSNIAHELKTPLSVIHSYTEGLKERIAEEKRDKYLDVILAETERLDDMVLSMLDLSRLEAGRVKLSRDEFELADIARNTLERLHLAIEGKNLSVELSAPDKTRILADEGRIAQVVENFITNAVKYTPVGGSIRIKITMDTTVTFAVENDAEPLSNEAISKVFDTFWRADESRSERSSSGLGLAIAKNIIDLHGGSCQVRNIPGGVCFSFRLRRM